MLVEKPENKRRKREEKRGKEKKEEGKKGWEGKKERKQTRKTERERESVAEAVSMARHARLRSGAEVWVGWVHILLCKELNMVLSIY